MNTIHYDGSPWPTRQQELLLRAALLQGKDAIDAWHAWVSDVDIEQLDLGSRRLLPLLYRNLRLHGVKDLATGRFKGVYRLVWYRNQMLFRDMTALLRCFHNAGVETMILKGAALILLHYRDYGLRPMNDFDVLVHTEQAPAAISVLTKQGWTPKGRPLEAFTDAYLSSCHSHGFEGAAGSTFDLHSHVLLECCYANADDDFWEGAVLTRVDDVQAYALNPTDQLLHVCVHGAQRRSVSNFDWAADAMMIMNTSQSDIDWNRLTAQTEKRRLSLPLKDTLSYLRDVLNAPIPLRVLKRIRKMPTSRIERFRFGPRARPPELLGPFSTIYLHYLRYLQAVRGAGVEHRLVGFLKYLQSMWALDHLWQVPLHAVFKGMRRIWRIAVRYANIVAGMLSQKP